MSDRRVRVRFAPSPTGPLHMGGVRTALYNYLFAKKHGGDFILRIEDTDQNRFVPGAAEYIIESLKWCGIEPNEGVGFGDGQYAPYRQSERKEIYRTYADQLIKSGHAYYAFDSEAELDDMRKRMEAAKASFSYNGITRQNMKNALTLSQDEVEKRIAAGENYVVRLKVPRNEEVRVKDIIRGWVVVNTTQMDDKVLFKSDGMPTYHLANVVDDYLMKITHVIRGEEWLPSAPLHVLLYRYLGWESVMPEFAHLPLLLKPDGNGKLSKRDGDRLGFPTFPLKWIDPETKEESSGYREKGYYPEAFINMLALLGWHPSGNQEVFTMQELIDQFSLERVSKSGAKFDPEKTKWFNQHYLRMNSNEELANMIVKRDKADQSVYYNAFEKKRKLFDEGIASVSSQQEAHSLFKKDYERQLNYLVRVCSLMKEKAYFLDDIIFEGKYFFVAPTEYDAELIKKRWNDNARKFFILLINNYKSNKDRGEALGDRLGILDDNFTAAEAEIIFRRTAEEVVIKPGEVMQLFRVLISGMATGSALFETTELLGKDEVIKRVEAGLTKLN